MLGVRSDRSVAWVRGQSRDFHGLGKLTARCLDAMASFLTGGANGRKVQVLEEMDYSACPSSVKLELPCDWSKQ